MPGHAENTGCSVITTVAGGKRASAKTASGALDAAGPQDKPCQDKALFLQKDVLGKDLLLTGKAIYSTGRAAKPLNLAAGKKNLSLIDSVEKELGRIKLLFHIINVDFSLHGQQQS